jgi:hypothetical protein
MEMILDLKVRYPKNVILMQADHEVPEGTVSPQDFPQRIKSGYEDPKQGETIYREYLNVFKEMPNVVFCGNGLVISHGGIPGEEINDLRELVGNQSAFKEMIWADPDFTLEKGIAGNHRRIASKNAEEALRDGLIRFSHNALVEFLTKIGGRAMVTGHRIGQGDAFNNWNKTDETIFYTVHSTGAGSDESHYADKINDPMFARFDKDVELIKIDPSRNILSVWS